MLRVLKALSFIAAAVAIAIVALRWLFPLPDLSGRPWDSALPPDPGTVLGWAVPDDADHQGLTGVSQLADGQNALGARLRLAAMAERSIDAQYYIWHDDVSGRLLLKALHDAALRGVQVRLLLDDNGVPGLDDTLAALNALQGFEIRLFNPSTIRRPKLAGYAIDFPRMNRRMHNKSFIVDGAAAVIGGRNIGDEYFQLGDNPFFLDMDVVAFGAVVPNTSAIFDEYWNSGSVFELENIVSGTGDLEDFLARTAEAEASDAAHQFRVAYAETADRIAAGELTLEWTHVQVVADDPAKGMRTVRRDQLMIARLANIMGEITSRLDLVSAYFVPGTAGTDFLSEQARDGRKVRVLTNALNTTDVLMVHSGYSKYRRDLLESGVDLYELKLRAGQMSGKAELSRLGLSGASLHAKTFAIDGDRVFVGSFNFDPRSAMLNCEMGFLIESGNLANRVHRAFDETLVTVSYRPALTPENKMIWHETLPDGLTVTYQEEPAASWFEQVSLVVIGLLPIEWLL